MVGWKCGGGIVGVLVEYFVANGVNEDMLTDCCGVGEIVRVGRLAVCEIVPGDTPTEGVAV